MAAHARLKNEFIEDEQYHNLIRWLICRWGRGYYVPLDTSLRTFSFHVNFYSGQMSRGGLSNGLHLFSTTKETDKKKARYSFFTVVQVKIKHVPV